MSTLQPVRGTHDLLPLEYSKQYHVTHVARVIAKLAGFAEIATPIMEFKDVFQRTLGDVSDIVTKEMYEIADRGGEEIVLRPEGTAGVVRAVISNGLTQSLPLKYFYAGPMFRYERPQKGRMRQLHQIGLELIGVSDPVGDVEVIALAYDILKNLHLENRVTLEINTLGDAESRKAYRDHLVSYLKDHHNCLSTDSQMRLDRNPLRILDSKDDGDRQILKGAPPLSEYLNEQSKETYSKVCEELDVLKIPYKHSPHLVRGLDYYCHVAFEFTTTDLGSQGTVLAGGRYDGLMETMGGPSVPGVGWAGGIDRLAMMLQDEMLIPAARPIVVIPMDECLNIKGLELAQNIRNQGWLVEMTYGGNLGKRFKKASKMNALVALILGEDEVKNNTVTFKDLDSGDQFQISHEKVDEILREKGVKQWKL